MPGGVRERYFLGRDDVKLPRRQFLHLAAGAAVLPAVSRVARAQAYPTRPVRIIDELGNGLGWKGWIYVHDKGLAAYACDRRDAARRKVDLTRIGHRKRVPCVRRTFQGLGGSRHGSRAL